MLKWKHITKISKKQAKDKIDQLESIDEFDEVVLSNKKTKLTIVGTKKDNMKKSNFEEIVLDFIKEQKDFNKKVNSRLDKIESRLDVLEQDMKDIKDYPTIKKEWKQSAK